MFGVCMILKDDFEPIFSMAKIKDDSTVPRYLHTMLAYPDIAWDIWWGDSEDGSQCKKIACQYGVGNVNFFFCFGRGSNKSLAEVSQGESLQFMALVARRYLFDGVQWYVKLYQNNDFEMVKNTIHEQDDNAVEVLGLQQANIQSPLDVIKNCFDPSATPVQPASLPVLSAKALIRALTSRLNTFYPNTGWRVRTFPKLILNSDGFVHSMTIPYLVVGKKTQTYSNLNVSVFEENFRLISSASKPKTWLMVDDNFDDYELGFYLSDSVIKSRLESFLPRLIKWGILLR